MKFVKENLLPLICGVVILLAIGFIFWPLGSWKDDHVQAMKDRLGQVDTVDSLYATGDGKGAPIVIPEGKTVPTIEQNVIEAEKEVQKNMHAQQTAITDTAAANNRQRRANPPSPANGNHWVPLLNGQAINYYLPKILPQAPQYGFRNAYRDLVRVWTDSLAAPSNGATPTPITDADITAAVAADQAKMHVGPAGAGAGAVSNPTADARVITDTARRLASNRASDIHMYVEPDAFSRQPWAATSLPPTAPQIFDGFVESWFQQDVVLAILSVNKGYDNVGHSPVKRLVRITVGPAAVAQTSVAAGTTGTGMFLTTAGAPGVAPAPTATPGIDTTRTMTGRIGDQNFDVVLMNISIDLDPAFQNRFIDALYRQNNGYTVINIKTTTVDPLDTVSKGYLYGDVQCVHLEILVEGLMFRNWTVPLMPDDTKTLLGISLTGPTPPPA